MSDSRRVAVFGATGAGKSTFARELSARLGLIHLELDSLYWESGWKPAERGLFLERVATAAAAEAWIIEGDYDLGREEIWRRADTIIWLQPALSTVLCRTLSRTVARAIAREKLWSGNTESLRSLFLSRESLLLWAWRSHRRRAREYPELLAKAAHEGKKVAKLTSTIEINSYLNIV